MRNEKLILVTCSTDLTIKLWDPANEYKNIRTLHGHDHSISTVRFTQDGERLVSASRDKTIRVWEVSSGYVLTSPHLTCSPPPLLCPHCAPLHLHPILFAVPSPPLCLPVLMGLICDSELMVDTASRHLRVTQNGSEK